MSVALFCLNSSVAAAGGAPDCRSFRYSLFRVTMAGEGCQATEDAVAAAEVEGPSATLSLQMLLVGVYRVEVAAVDLAGLVQPLPAVRTWTVEGVAGSLLLANVSGPPAVSALSRASFYFQVKLLGAVVRRPVVETKLTGGEWAAQESLWCHAQTGHCNFTLYGLAVGEHELQLRPK